MSDQRPPGSLPPDVQVNVTEQEEQRKKTVPFFEFEGTEDEGVKYQVQNYLEGRRANFFLPREVEPSPEQEQYINFVLEELQEYIKELGLNTERLPTRQQVHLLKENDFKEFMKQRQEQDRIPEHAADTNLIQGFHLNQDGHVVISASAPPEKLIHFLGHELTHEASYLSFKIDDSKPDIKINIAKTGFQYYHRGEDLEVEGTDSIGFNEAMVELTGFHIRERLLAKHADTLKQSMSDEALGYLGVSVEYASPIQVVLDMVRAVAETKSQSAKEIYLRFRRSLFTGDDQIFAEIENALGPSALAVFKEMVPGHDQAVETARKLGFDHALQILAEHRPLELI